MKNLNPLFKLWTKGNRGVFFQTLEQAKEQAQMVFEKTGVVLLITCEQSKAFKALKSAEKRATKTPTEKSKRKLERATFQWEKTL